MELVNYTLNWVWETIDEVLRERSDICKCEKCRHDIACLSANRLQPHYVVSDSGMIYTKLRMLSYQNHIDILTEVAKAVEQVSHNPHHEK